jgi:hypothetical protein
MLEELFLILFCGVIIKYQSPDGAAALKQIFNLFTEGQDGEDVSWDDG